MHDYQLGAILDVAAGDGSLALAAVRHRLPYTGIVFTTCHRDLTMARLLGVLPAGAPAGWRQAARSLIGQDPRGRSEEENNDEEAGQEPAKKKPT